MIVLTFGMSRPDSMMFVEIKTCTWPSTNFTIASSSSLAGLSPWAVPIPASGAHRVDRPAAKECALDRLADHHRIVRQGEGARGEPVDRRRGDEREIAH